MNSYVFLQLFVLVNCQISLDAEPGMYSLLYEIRTVHGILIKGVKTWYVDIYTVKT